MVAEHNLAKDFPELVDELKRLQRSDPSFAHLVERYETLDKSILALEKNDLPSDDEKLAQLKRERILLKDKIAQQLTYG